MSNISEYDPTNTQYRGDSEVSFNGALYRAQWWAPLNQYPGDPTADKSQNPWVYVSAAPGNPPSYDSSNERYWEKSRVLYNGKIYEAKWWASSSDTPGSASVWHLEGSADTDGATAKRFPQYDSSQAYGGNSEVEFNGAVYKAQWWVPAEKYPGNPNDDTNVNAWRYQGPVNGDPPAYDSSNEQYWIHSRVVYQGNIYEALWWAPTSDTPGQTSSGSAWKLIGPAAGTSSSNAGGAVSETDVGEGDPPKYENGRSYEENTEVTFNGYVWSSWMNAPPGDVPGMGVDDRASTAWRRIRKASSEESGKGEIIVDGSGIVDPWAQEEVEVDAVYGALSWSPSLTSTVEFTSKVALKRLVFVTSPGLISSIGSSTQVSSTKSTFEGMDKYVIAKKAGIIEDVTTFSFSMSITAANFESLQFHECTYNGLMCEITFMQREINATAEPRENPFPTKVAVSGRMVDASRWSAKNTTYNTYRRKTYSSSSGDKEYLVGGYFTDWGVYKGFGTARLPINNINFVQIAFAAVVGPGDDSDYYCNTSASPEAREKIPDLARGKPVGTILILDHWSHYGKKDMNVPEWVKPYGELAYHVDGYERGLNFLGYGYPDKYPIHNNSEGVVLREEGKLNYAYGIQNDFRSYHQALNRNGRKFNMFLSIGGWTLSDPFPYIAASSTYRRTFVDSVKEYLNKNRHINGIDIDWEFPGKDGSKPGIMGSRDKNNYTKLMKELKDGLDELGRSNDMHYELSAAIGTTPEHLDKINWSRTIIDGVAYPGMGDILDNLFLMSYDYYGPWTATTPVGHQSPLYDNGTIAGRSVHTCVNSLKSYGVPSRKIIVGVAAYGRIWKQVEETNLNTNNTYTFPNMAQGSSPEGSSIPLQVSYHHLNTVIHNSDGSLKSGFEWVRDTRAKAEFLVYTDPSTNSKTVVTTDTKYSVEEKARYVKEQELGGIFMWSLDLDNGDMINAMHDGLGSEKISSTLEPSYRENSLLLFRVKEANYASNANIKQRYGMSKIRDVIGNAFTFGGYGVVQAFNTLLSLPSALANETSYLDLTDEQWEEYLTLMKSVDQFKDITSGLTKDEAIRSANDASATLGYQTIDLLFSESFLLGIGVAAGGIGLTAGGMDALVDVILAPSGGSYAGRITRGTLDPWSQMRKDIPAITYNY